MAKSQPAPLSASPSRVTSSSVRFTFGQLLSASRHAHPEFRRQDRLEEHLGWPHRKVLWLEHNRIRPTEADLSQLTEALPILRLLLDRAQPAPREIQTAGRV